MPVSHDEGQEVPDDAKQKIIAAFNDLDDDVKQVVIAAFNDLEDEEDEYDIHPKHAI